MIGLPIGQAPLAGVGFPDPSADPEAKKRAMLAQMLMQQNSQPAIGATGAFSNILGGAMAGYQMGQQAKMGQQGKIGQQGEDSQP